MVVPASIDRFKRISSGHFAMMVATSITSPISASSSGYVPGFSIV